MQTVELSRLKLRPGQRVLDAGCGGGRHLTAAFALPGVQVVGLDINWDDLCRCRENLRSHGRVNEHELPEARAVPAGSNDPAPEWLIVRSTLTALPFRDDSFQAVICSEVLEHIADNELAIQELVRVLKPGGSMVVSVPRFFPERICWALSTAYHQEPGGHIRIYRKGQLLAAFKRFGLIPLFINYKHALHSPYWWLKCIVGHRNDRSPLVRLYRRFLEWDIMKRPVWTSFLEKMLNPLVGKSIVFYLRKG